MKKINQIIKLCLMLFILCMLIIPLQSAAEETITTVKLSFAGDCTLGGNESWMNYKTGTFMAVMAEQDYSYPFQHAKDIFAKDDYTLINFEGVLSDTSKGINRERKWNFRGPTEYANILVSGSIEAVNLGNNHTKDYGNYGMIQTKKVLSDNGIGFCETKDICYYEKNNVKIAFLGFWETAFHSNRKWIKQVIPMLKADEGCDAVVVVYHGGNEYIQKHAKTQTEDLHYAIDCGADLCIGHHPHVIQGIEVYKNRTILYSLGNFSFGGNRKPREIEYPTYVAAFELGFDTSGYLYQQLTIHPFSISGTSPRNNYQPVPVTDKKASEVIALIQMDTSFPLQSFIEGMGAVQERIYKEQ